jgi:hypothetical protein
MEGQGSASGGRQVRAVADKRTNPISATPPLAERKGQAAGAAGKTDMPRGTRMAAPVSFILWLAITPASKPLDARGEIVGVRLKEIVFMLEVKDGVLLFALLHIETETITVAGCRERQTIYRP